MIDPNDPWAEDNIKAEIASALHNARFKWEELKLLWNQDGCDRFGEIGINQLPGWCLWSDYANDLVAQAKAAGIEVELELIEPAWHCTIGGPCCTRNDEDNYNVHYSARNIYRLKDKR